MLKMTNDRCFPNLLQDTLNRNPLKKCNILLKMIAVAAAMISSVCVCFLYLKQMEIPSKPYMVRFNMEEQAHSHIVRISVTEKNLPSEVRVNLTEKILPLVKANMADVKFHRLLKANISEKTSHSPNMSRHHLHLFDSNKTKGDNRKDLVCMPVSLYAIVSMQRSGSKWFEALLDSHDNIRSRGEIFYDVDRKCNMTVIKKVLDKAFRRNKTNCLSAVGFKWMLNQGILDNHKEIVDYFNRRGVSVILLFRRNHLRRLVSIIANNHDGIVKELNGTHRAHVYSKDEAETLARYKPKLNIKSLIPTLEHMESLVTDTLNNFKSTRHMVVYYEDLVQNHPEKMMEVLEFLKTPQRELISNHVKIHTRPLAQQIRNWRSVAKAIKLSKYSNFINVKDYEMKSFK